MVSVPSPPGDPLPRAFIRVLKDSLSWPSLYGLGFLLGLLVFFGSLAAGLVYELHYEDRFPGISLNYLEAADRLLGEGDLNAALDQYRVSTTIAPDDHVAFSKLGVVAYQAGRTDESTDALLKSLQRHPANAQAHYLLGLIRLDQGELELSVKHNLAAVQLRPSYAEAYNNLATALVRQGDRDGARQYYRRALDIDPFLTPARRSLDLLETQQRY